MNKPVCIELFAGGGGMMLGLEMAGYKTVVANEVHPQACLTLKRNFPEVPIVESSIKSETGESLLSKAGLKLGDEIDLIAGGPPCQGFSMAGSRNVEDPRNTLVSDFIRIVKEVRPKQFIFENVVGIQTLDNGQFFEFLCNEIADMKYNFNYKILKAADFGVPQARKRLILIGSRDGAVPIHPNPTHFDPFLKKSNSYITVREALGDLPIVDQGGVAMQYDKDPTSEYQAFMRLGSSMLYNHECATHTPQTIEYYSLIPVGGTPKDLPEHLRKKKQSLQRLPLDGVSRTITTEPGDFIHPSLNRTPTVREFARLQSFPDRFKFLGPRSSVRDGSTCSQMQQVGNAVPPLMARAIGEQLIKQL